MMASELYADYVIVGGGVAGVCIVEELDELLESEEVPGTSDQRIFFITGRGGFIKRTMNMKQIGQVTSSFDVELGRSDILGFSKRIKCFDNNVIRWESARKTIILDNGVEIKYDKLAIATGASPKSMFQSSPFVIRLRDTQTIKDFERKLEDARRVLIIGNGGIASELAFELKNVEIIWAIRHHSISANYFDASAAKFFEENLNRGRTGADNEQKNKVKMDRFTSLICQNEQNQCDADGYSGSALGPHWLAKLAQKSGEQKARNIHIVMDMELEDFSTKKPEHLEQIPLPDNFLSNANWNVWAELSNGICVGCDLIIEATGVVPNSSIWKRDCPELELADDAGILVDDHMRTNIADVFAAGDVCTASWGHGSPHWKQIRLWTQARQMGIYCGRAMLIDNLLLDISFDLFSHVTIFFGYKVVLLGDFTGEKLQKPFQLNYRITEGHEYVKMLTKDHKVQGAVLIGETEMEEVIENLILNQTDISQIEDNFLEPDVDLDDFFD